MRKKNHELSTFQRNNMKPKTVAMLYTEFGLTMVEVFFGVSVEFIHQWGHVRIIMIIFIIMIITMTRRSDMQIMTTSNVVYKVLGQARDFGIGAGFSFQWGHLRVIMIIMTKMTM